MSYEVWVWSQPAGTPLPADAAAVTALLAALPAQAEAAPNPRYLELARLMNGRFPAPPGGRAAPFPEAPLDGLDAGVPWVVSLQPGDRLEVVLASLVTWAMALGLCVADRQTGSAWLPDGRIVGDDPAAACMPALALYHGGDRAGAWAEWVSLGRAGNRAALRQLAVLVEDGEMGPPNLPLALALLHHASLGAEAEALALSMTPAQCDTAMRLLDRLREQPALFGSILDTALQPAAAVPAVAAPVAAAAGATGNAAAAQTAPAAPTATARPPTPRPAPVEDDDSPIPRSLARAPLQRRVPVDDRPPSAGVDAVLAMVAGALAIPLWIVAGVLGGDWAGRIVLLGCLGAGAWGVWQGGLARGWDGAQSAFHAALAAVPVVGWLPIWRVLLRRP